MRPAEITAHRKKQPFVPFRLCMSDGASYEVRHPEMVLVTRSLVVIAVYDGKHDEPDTAFWCDPVHVVRIETGNGHRHGRGRRRGKK